MGFKDAQNFSFERSISPSNGLFYYLDRDGREQPVALADQTQVGAFGSHTDNDKKLDDALVAPNPSRSDVAMLPIEADTIRIRYGLSVVSNALAPRICNDRDTLDKIKSLAIAYARANGFYILAHRHARRILDAGWLWRNYKLSTDRQVTVKSETGEVITTVDETTMPPVDDSDADATPIDPGLVESIRAALAGETRPLRLIVEGQGTVGPGQEIFPSQEFVDPKRQNGVDSNKGRHLAYVTTHVDGHDAPIRQPIFHAQKIGNALRQIDDWYDADAHYGRIAVEPYGMMLNRLEAARKPEATGNDLYSYLHDLAPLIKRVEAASGPEDLEGDAHFVMACLVRGGVFSAASKKGTAENSN